MHALSVPTWIIHVSSTLEWIVAIWFVWQYSQLQQQSTAWRWLPFAMLPSLVGAMAACTWHFFDNAPHLAWLVLVQASMTFIGNCTLCLAAWWIWRSARSSTGVP